MMANEREVNPRGEGVGTDVHDPAADNVSIVRVPRTIVIGATKGSSVDESVVQFPFYNSFNYSLLAEDKKRLKFTVGITSANPHEGKTVTAVNLAVSLTLGYRRRTVLIDLNFRQPRVNEIFGTVCSPGLIDALDGGPIHLSPTQIDHLFVLPSGLTPGRNGEGWRNGRTAASIGVQHTSAFGEIIAALQQEFDFVLVDMPPMNAREFPVLFVNHLDGLLLVVQVGKTKRNDVERMFRHLNRNQVLGFVFNRTVDGGEELA